MNISSYLAPRALFLFLLAAFVPAGQALAQNEAAFVPNQLIVKYREGTPQSAVDAINARHGIGAVRKAKSRKFAVVRIPAGKSERAVAASLSANPNVEYAEPNFIAHAHYLPNDPLYQAYQWHMDEAANPNPYGGDNGGGINVEPAWDISTGTGVIVAVIDTGVAYKDGEDTVPVDTDGTVKTVSFAQAPDLADTMFVPGYDFVSNDSAPFDDAGHGTHVTGTIAQSTHNGLGVAGVAYGCSIMPIKALGADGSGTYAAIADGIIWAADNGANVINLSLGGSSPSTTLESALAYAYAKGVTIVCSSGNDGASTVSYPAAYDAYCLAVGATGYDEAVTAYSNQGESLDLTAPGGDMSVDLNGDGYGDGILQQTHDGSDFTTFSYFFYQGTSMAAPHVSGLAALIISAGVATTPDEVREAILVTAEDKGLPDWDPAYGWGIIDAHAAVTYERADSIVAGSFSVIEDFDSYTAGTSLLASPNWVDWGDADVNIVSNGSGNHLEASSNTWCGALRAETFADDQYAEIDILAAGGSENAGVVVRASGPANASMYLARWREDGKLYLFTKKDGKGYPAASYVIGAATGRLRLEAAGKGSGTRLQVYVDTGSGWRHLVADYDPPAYIDAGAPGFRTRHVAIDVDNFAAGDLYKYSDSTVAGSFSVTDNLDSYTAGTRLLASANWVTWGDADVNIVSNGSGNHLEASSNTWCGALRAETFADDQYAEIDIVAAGGWESAGVVVRASGPAHDSMYLARWKQDGNLYLFTRKDGTGYRAVSYVIGAATGRLRLEAAGKGSATRLQVYVDTGSGWRHLVADYDPPAYIDSGSPGVRTRHADIDVDNFAAGDL